MKRFIKLVSTSLVGMSLMMGVAAADATSCTISNTGANSVNTCTSTTTQSVSVVCDTDVNAINVGGQIATTGNANGGGNTTLAGGVTTGSAVNYNGTTFVLGASCNGQPTPVATAATPVAGGQGAVTPTAAPAAPAAKPAALPETGSNAVLTDSIIGAAVLGGTIVVAQLGLSAYRRLALK